MEVGPIRPLTPALSPEAGEREPESETCAVGITNRLGERGGVSPPVSWLNNRGG